ncbi:MAG: sulfotransferase domain-containing protein, partial [Candidatus Marinimicrobia bacterium]|nr:sulfotransferase domain-containing protein [Candidatus Neomarinimicrobiota bacterium]
EWQHGSATDPRVLLISYEDLMGDDGIEALERLLSHIGCHLGSSALDELYSKHSFQTVARRQPGEENVFDHLRRGLPGDFRNHFSAADSTYLRKRAGDLVTQLGYRDV